MEKREAPVIHIGMDAEGAKEAWNGILKILESKRSDHLVEIALDVYKSLGRVSHITITDCNFSGPTHTYEPLKLDNGRS